MGKKLLGEGIDDKKAVRSQDLLFLFIVPERLFDLDPIFSGQPLEGFRVAVFLMFHDKADRVAAAAASETFVDLFRRGDRKRGRLLIMKRTEAKVIGASFLQLDKTADHIDNVKPAKYLLYGPWGDHGEGQVIYFMCYLTIM